MKKSRYVINGMDFIGVTSVLDLLDKAFLPVWRQGLTIDYIMKYYEVGMTIDVMEALMEKARLPIERMLQMS